MCINISPISQVNIQITQLPLHNWARKKNENVLPSVHKSVTICNNVVHSRVNLDLRRVSSVLKSGEPSRHHLLQYSVTS